MSHDNSSKNAQGTAIGAAFSIFNYGMFCANRCMEEYTNVLRLSTYFSKSYADIFYGNGINAEKIFVRQKLLMSDIPNEVADKIVIPIHEIKEVTYGNLPVLAPDNQMNPMLKK
ncbi:MAG: hypothetical protein HY833_03350 [Candidatus Aenigmarchaeota archaeon]|nr:hypothetical protein [Candidatus Aenigmarchaeota archaeon]